MHGFRYYKTYMPNFVLYNSMPHSAVLLNWSHQGYPLDKSKTKFAGHHDLSSSRLFSPSPVLTR